MVTMKNKLSYRNIRKILFLVALGGCFIWSLVGAAYMDVKGFIDEYKKTRWFREQMAHQIIGHQFNGLDEFTKDIAIMGYYTDRNLKDKEDAKIFSHAQYRLAPTVLDFKNLNHEYILFVTSNEVIAWRIMKELNAQPLRRNKFGMILARRKL